MAEKLVKVVESRLAQAALRLGEPAPPREAAEALMDAAGCRVDATWKIISAFQKPSGHFEADTVVSCFIYDGMQNGWQSAASRVAVEEAETPRTIMRRTLATMLVAADHRYASNRGLAIEHARAVEVSCYNTTVAICQAAEEPPLRSWTNPVFLDVYSTRCGAIAGLLDLKSAACRAYGAEIASALASGQLDPAEIGSMSESDLCPKATAAERRTIAARADQKVDEKESTMFMCPFCHARSCTYSQIQCRSLDEAPDYKCCCLKCGRRFTGRG